MISRLSNTQRRSDPAILRSISNQLLESFEHGIQSSDLLVNFSSITAPFAFDAEIRVSAAIAGRLTPNHVLGRSGKGCDDGECDGPEMERAARPSAGSKRHPRIGPLRARPGAPRSTASGASDSSFGRIADPFPWGRSTTKCVRMLKPRTRPCPESARG